MNQLILLASWIFVIWLVRRDEKNRVGLSRATWIPTLWVGVLASRPISAWLGWSSGDTLEGSPVDRFFFFGMILSALLVLSRRSVPWGQIYSRNWALFLFYGFLLVSVVWANSPLSSFKRWTKEAGNILIVLVILTEANPLEAIRAVFVRCAWVLVPLSIVFVRYFPDLGRRYSIHSGELEITGVTTQKNSLGAMILVCGLVFVWDWLERTRPDAPLRSRTDKFLALLLMAAATWLIYLSDSKTSMTCLALACVIIAAVRVPVIHRRVSGMGIYLLVAAGLFALLDSQIGLTTTVVSNLGRDMTFTGRTDVWRELLAVRTDPLFGTGFMSFWDDLGYRSRLPDWVAFSAHNGYLEIYLAGGVIGVGLLALLILSSGFRINRALATQDTYAVVRFAVFVAALLANFSESNFACMTPLGFLFLVAVIGDAQPAPQPYGWAAEKAAFESDRSPVGVANTATPF
jgi:exopolysaccharide production protein ExoQ